MDNRLLATLAAGPAVENAMRVVFLDGHDDNTVTTTDWAGNRVRATVTPRSWRVPTDLGTVTVVAGYYPGEDVWLAWADTLPGFETRRDYDYSQELEV